MTIKPSQCRAGRALVDMSVAALSRAANISADVISAFEKGKLSPNAAVLVSLQEALENFGVRFIPENGGGVGVRLKFNASEVRRIAMLEGEGGIVRNDDV